MLESNNMASQSQRFCLRWNNHQSNLLSVFDQLLQEQCFVDVTLAVEGRFLRAHKMVLSACSPYFQTLFTEHPDKHPIVILKDVPYADMRCLLDFMYRGEVSVNQDRLTAFLKVAETLRIKGLTEVKEDRGGELPASVLPPPQLHRIAPRPFGYPPLMAAPLLGSALTAPKRKRGRPRKLSGSSEVEAESDGERGGDSLNLPELLEIRMDDGRDERCSNGDGELDADADVDDDELPLPPDTSGAPPGTANMFPLGPPIKEEPADEDTRSIPPSTPPPDIKSEPGAPGFHFLTDEGYSEINEIIDNLPKTRSDLLEYLVQPDGSVVCKWCGEVLPSRTHWYRHKYKLHVPAAGLPAGLSKCLKCNTFFKSRKGYVGHCVARHGSVEEAEREDEEPIVKTEVDDEDLENVAVNAEEKKTLSDVSGRGRKRSLKDEMKEDYIRQREREEKLVADIIAKVKRECEAQSITMCRRGYSRRSTVMTSFKEYDKRKPT